MDVQEAIDEFLRTGPFAVAGASIDRTKYGNKILRCYLQHGLEVHAVNPNRTLVEGLTCYPTLREVPARLRSVSIITPPDVTERIVGDAAAGDGDRNSLIRDYSSCLRRSTSAT